MRASNGRQALSPISRDANHQMLEIEQSVRLFAPEKKYAQGTVLRRQI
jgi:hypothetical protein